MVKLYSFLNLNTSNNEVQFFRFLLMYVRKRHFRLNNYDSLNQYGYNTSSEYQIFINSSL